MAAPSGWHWVVTEGALRARILRILTAELEPGLETTTLMAVLTLSFFLIREARETWPEAFFLVKDFLAQPLAQVAVTVEPAGTFLTTSVESLVVFLVELKLKPSVTTICGAATVAAG